MYMYMLYIYTYIYMYVCAYVHAATWSLWNGPCLVQGGDASFEEARVIELLDPTRILIYIGLNIMYMLRREIHICIYIYTYI